MALLEARQSILILLDGRFELFDILRAAFTESCLRLSIPLFAFFRCGVYLDKSVPRPCQGRVSRPYRLPSTFSLLRLRGFLRRLGARFSFWGRLDGAGSAIARRLDLALGSHVFLHNIAVAHLQEPDNRAAQRQLGFG